MLWALAYMVPVPHEGALSDRQLMYNVQCAQAMLASANMGPEYLPLARSAVATLVNSIPHTVPELGGVLGVNPKGRSVSS